MHLLLFDIDGVLVEARGYLRALQDTVAHFSHQMGVGSHPPTEAEVRALEANGLTSEWDSAPTCVAVLLLQRLRRMPSLRLPAAWPEALSMLGNHPCALPHPDYAAVAQRVGAYRRAGLAAAETARAALWDEARSDTALQDHLPALSALLEDLLGHTHDFYRAPLTRHFQHRAIGSQMVAATYDIAPDFDSPAYLTQFDQPLLSTAVRQRLSAAAATGRVRMALYTARPSLPPADTQEPHKGYSPEAELARSLVGLEDTPLIGLGRMAWLARRVGERVERLVKPSPVQALAAAGAACSGQEGHALEAAWALYRDDGLQPPLADLRRPVLHVFEDAASGLEAVGRAAAMLGAAGLAADWRPYGIAPVDGPKAAALTARNAPIYPSVNEAIMAALAAL